MHLKLKKVHTDNLLIVLKFKYNYSKQNKFCRSSKYYLLVSSSDNRCKQSGPKSGGLVWIQTVCYHADGIPKIIFRKCFSPPPKKKKT